jgi:hypothetical protein
MSPLLALTPEALSSVMKACIWGCPLLEQRFLDHVQGGREEAVAKAKKKAAAEKDGQALVGIIVDRTALMKALARTTVVKEVAASAVEAGAPLAVEFVGFSNTTTKGIAPPSRPAIRLSRWDRQ